MGKRLIYFLIFAPINFIPKMVKFIWRYKIFFITTVIILFIFYVFYLLFVDSIEGLMDLRQTRSFSWKNLTSNLFEQENKQRQLEYEKQLNYIHTLNKYFSLKNVFFLKKPVLSLVIDQLGYDPVILSKVIKLPPEIGLGFSVFAPNLKGDIEQAHKYGHDVFIDIPMKSFANEINFYGDVFLEPLNDIEESKGKIDQLLSNFPPSVDGVINEGGNFSLNNKKFFECFASLIAKKHLIFLSRPTISTNKKLETIYPYLLDYALGGNKNIVMADFVFGSESGSINILNKKIKDLLINLQNKKFSIVIIDPYPNLVSWTSQWIKTLQNEQLIKISALMKNLYVQVNNK